MQTDADSRENLTRQFLFIGRIEGYSYLLLLLVAMPLKYLYGLPQAVRAVGLIHGLLFIAFVGALYLMWKKAGMSLKNAGVAFLLSLLPFGTFFLKRLV